jgi:hypothetical protein
VAGHYVSVLQKGSIRPRLVATALRGLAEVRDDRHSFVASFGAHRSTRVRKAACRALGALDARGERQVLEGLLDDPSRTVAREASLVLCRFRLTEANLSRLWASALRRADDALMSALWTLDRWLLLDLACRGLLSEDPRGIALGASLMRRVDETWNRSFTSPTPALRQRLSEALPRALARHSGSAPGIPIGLKPFFPGLG